MGLSARDVLGRTGVCGESGKGGNWRARAFEVEERVGLSGVVSDLRGVVRDLKFGVCFL